ncbi:NtaA/DmoA family FMN-dependent monooxygenase [Vibrio fluvialis]|nr:NtaA/DmoA family FMN-dependent monooxygenase [Vibrio fluvialis]
MSSPQPLCIGMALAISWLTKNGWRRDDSGVERMYDTDVYVELAQRAERAKLDFLFRPDTLFLATHAVATEPGFSSLDPMVLLATLARETTHIGLVSTASTTFNPPYVVARQLQSLNWVTQGRAGWNIVTAIDGQQNFGQQTMLPSEARYQKAREFTDVVLQLWNSYPSSAIKADKQSGQYADIDQIQPIAHHGDYFDVQGPLNVPKRPGGDIPLFQAGASESGRQFAASIADAIFAATPDIDAGVELRNDLRRRALAHGRPAHAVKVLPGLSLYLADTREEAQALHRETHANIDNTRKFAYVKEALGLDLSQFDPEQRITADMLPHPEYQVRSQTHSNLLRRLIERESPTVATLIERPEVIGSAHWIVIGTVDDAFNAIVERVNAGAADGFIAVPGGSWQSVDLFFDELIPRLSQAGLFRSDYQGRTLRDHLGL